MNFIRIATNFGCLNDFQEYLNKIWNRKRNKQRTGPRHWTTASAQRTSRPALLDRPQVAGAAQPALRTEASTCTGPVTAHRARVVVRPPTATRPTRRRAKAGKSIGRGKTFPRARWEAVDPTEARGSLLVEACGHRRRAPTIPVDGERDGGGELHTATKGRRKNTRGGGYHRSSEPLEYDQGKD
jgi:hypothetical protein